VATAAEAATSPDLDVPESETRCQRLLESRVRTVVQLRQVAGQALVASRGEVDQRLIDRRDSYACLEAQLWVLLEAAKAMSHTGVSLAVEAVVRNCQARQNSETPWR
jgi:hypothetical protein